jgi:ABC-type lipoprotein export system ATPase subunit
MAIVHCDNLIKIYRIPATDLEVVALQGLDLDVEQGEIVGLIGRSGSGKTTLLQILGGLDLPSAGKCVVQETELARLSEREQTRYRRQVVGHVWQQSGRNLVSGLSVLANIQLPQQLAGVERRAMRRRTDDLLAAVGLSDKADSLPAHLSGGEQQRAAIAVALANSPSVLLADEPTGALDTVSAQGILNLLRDLNQGYGLTILIVTHDPLVARWSDRTMTIRDGRTSVETTYRGPAFGQETVLLDRAGRMQIPSSLRAACVMAGRTVLTVSGRSLELQLPRGTPGQDTLVVDAQGWLQLPQETLTQFRFAGRALVRQSAHGVALSPLPTQESNISLKAEQA